MGVGVGYTKLSVGVGMGDLFALIEQPHSYLIDVTPSVSNHQMNNHFTSLTLLYLFLCGRGRGRGIYKTFCGRGRGNFFALIEQPHSYLIDVTPSVSNHQMNNHFTSLTLLYLFLCGRGRG